MDARARAHQRPMLWNVVNRVLLCYIARRASGLGAGERLSKERLRSRDATVVAKQEIRRIADLPRRPKR
jgi:hypothetical protein